MRPILFLSLLAISAFGFNDTGAIAPQTEKMEPRIGKPGTIVKITGKALDRAHVDEVYLTDHRFDLKVKVLEQTASQLTIRIPPFVKPGRLQLLLLTAGAKPAYLEQPLFLLIEASDEEPLPATPPVEISQKSKPTVEVAATGTHIPVPMAGTPPSPSTVASVERSVVPLKAEPIPTVAEPKAQLQVKETKTVESPKPVEVAMNRTPNPDPPPAPAPAATPIVNAVVPVNPTPQVAQAPTVTTNVPAQVVRRTRVAYPATASAQRVEGTVELMAVIRTDGRVKDVKVIRGNPFLVAAAVASVKEWLYEPAYSQGKPVESEVPIILNFKRP